MIPLRTPSLLLLSLLCSALSAGPRVDRHGDPLPEHAVARIGTTRLRHGTAVTLLCYSPDGKTLAASAGRTVSLWDVGTGKELRRLTVEEGLRGLCFSADGKVLLGWAEGKPIQLWDVATGKEQKPPPEWPGSVTRAAFSGDGGKVAVYIGPLDPRVPLVPGRISLQVLDVKTQAQRGEILRVQIYKQDSQASESQISSQIYGGGGLGCSAFHRD